MAKIVAAIGQSHILFDREGAEHQADKVFDGYRALGDQVRAARPDVLVIVTGDHLFNVSTAHQVPLSIAVGDEHVPFGDMDVPKRPFKGHRAFAEGFVDFAFERGFDIAKLEAEGFAPDHGTTLPVMFMNPQGAIPTVILDININMRPTPSPRRCWQLGTALGEYIREVRPPHERVAVAGTGGLSHWLNVPRDGEINAEWDEQVLRTFAEGRAYELSRQSVADIERDAGNGGVEINFWLVMAAAVPTATGEKVFYEPMPSWKTGMGAVRMHV